MSGVLLLWTTAELRLRLCSCFPVRAGLRSLPSWSAAVHWAMPHASRRPTEASASRLAMYQPNVLRFSLLKQNACTLTCNFNSCRTKKRRYDRRRTSRAPAATKRTQMELSSANLSRSRRPAALIRRAAFADESTPLVVPLPAPVIGSEKPSLLPAVWISDLHERQH